MQRGLRGSVALGRANPFAPVAVFLCGLGVALVASHAVGFGIAIGALLALGNGVLLSRRIDTAAGMNDVGHALLVMQLGLVITCTVIGAATIVMIHFSLSMTIAAAVGFAVAQIGSLAAFYWLKGRDQSRLEGKGA